MKRDRKMSAFLVLTAALSAALVPVPVRATVQLLPETTLLMREQKITGQSGLLRHPVVTGLLAAFERAESAPHHPLF